MSELSGRVVDPQGEPVIGARVWVEPCGDKRYAESLTDTEGRFRIERIHRHTWELLIEAKGVARQYFSSASNSIFPRTDGELGTIRLDRGRVFTGQVLDADGAPLPKAMVECEAYRYYLGHTFQSIGAVEVVSTDADGYFTTPPLPVGRLYLKVRFPGRRLAHVLRAVEPNGEEELTPILLESDVPLGGTVQDEQGQPIVGATMSASDVAKATSDAEGQFTLRGFGPHPRFQLQVQKEGYVFVNWAVIGREDGFRWREVGGDGTLLGPVANLNVTMKAVTWIEGHAIDADTGDPVFLQSAVLCSFERRPNGEIVRSGCRGGGFEQPEAGHFRIPYSHPSEFHLTLSAEGYLDAEAFMPKVTQLQAIGGIDVKMKKERPGSKSDVPRQTISGTVVRDGVPVKIGWVSVYRLRRAVSATNAFILRGRTVEGDACVCTGVPLLDGGFTADVPYQNDALYLAVEQAGHALTQVGPISLGLNEEKTLEIACVEGGDIGGRVKNVPEAWEGHVWVVAFTKTGIRAETRVDPQGNFAFHHMPPGEYGLKVGHDAYEDSEVPRGDNVPSVERDKPADPWRRAKVVTVVAGQDSGEVELELAE